MAYDIIIYNDSGIIMFTSEPVFYVNRGTSSSGTRPSGISGKLAVKATNSGANIYRSLSGTFITSDGGNYDWVEFLPVSSAIPSVSYGFLIRNTYNTVVFDSNKPPPTIAYNSNADFTALTAVGSSINLTMAIQKTNLKYYISEDSLRVCVCIGATGGNSKIRMIKFSSSSNIGTLTVSSDISAATGSTGNYTRGLIVPVIIFQA